MIIYFSGTGNTHAVASLLGELTGEKVEFMLDFDPRQSRFNGKRLIFLFPVYSWGVAPIILDYVRRLPKEFIRDLADVPVYAVCTCGDDTGLAMEMFEKALEDVGLRLRGSWSVQMPNNYVLLPGFDVDSDDVEIRKLDKFPERVMHISEVINLGKEETDVTIGSFPKFKSRIIYPLFKKWGIFPSRWYAKDSCIGCGRCERACVVSNITMDKENNRPVWGNSCVSCLACYHVCPVNAVQYGRSTRGKGQYWCKVKNLGHLS